MKHKINIFQTNFNTNSYDLKKIKNKNVFALSKPDGSKGGLRSPAGGNSGNLNAIWADGGCAEPLYDSPSIHSRPNKHSTKDRTESVNSARTSLA